MRFDLTEEQKLLEQTVREFANAEVKPLAKQLDETGQFPRETFRRAAELGLTGIALPEQYGGAAFDYISYAIVIEEISRVCASTGPSWRDRIHSTAAQFIATPPRSRKSACSCHSPAGKKSAASR